MPIQRLDGVSINYELSGEGPPMVLIAGWTLNIRFWERVLPQFESGYRVLRYDPRGTGGSTSDPRLEYSRLSDAEDLHALLEALGHRPAHLVGHSKGARIALTFAARHPEQVLSVTAVGSAEPRLGGAFEEKIQAWVSEAKSRMRFEGFDGAMGFLREESLLGPIHADAEGLRLLRLSREGYGGADLTSATPKRRFSVEDHLDRLTMPVLFLSGDRDLFLEECEFAHESIHGSSLRVIPRCGHFPPIERPAQFTGTTQEFLDSRRGNP